MGAGGVRCDARSRRGGRCYDGACGCLGSRRWPSTTAAPTSPSLRLPSREYCGKKVPRDQVSPSSCATVRYITTPIRAALVAQHLEGGGVVDGVAFHEDA